MPPFKPFAFSLFLLGLSLSISLEPGWPRNEANLYREALAAKDRGDSSRAIELFKRALSQNAKLSEAHFQLGLLYCDLKRLNEAENSFREYLRSYPNSLEAHSRLAAVYAQQGKIDMLERELETIIRVGPGSPQAYEALADYHLRLALRSLWKVYKNAPASARDEIAARLARTIAVSPNSAENFFFQGNMARLQGNKDQARDFYLRAGQLDSNYQPRRLYEDARNAAQNGDFDEALDKLLAISTLRAGFLESELLTAEILLTLKDYQGALAHLESVSSAGANNSNYLKYMAESYRGLGKPGKAIPYLESVTAKEGTAALRRALAEAYKANGDYTKAISEYEKLLKTEANPEWVHQEIVSLTKQKLQAVETVTMPKAAASDSSTRVPDVLLLIPSNSRFAIVEKETQTLFLYRNGAKGYELERTFPCSTGAHGGEKLEQGDEKTPEGVYLLQRILPGSKLPKRYGKMAITLDYPNPVDRLEGKGGDGIWLHATDEPIRAYLPNTTHGCVVVSNDDIQRLSTLITLNHTPFVIVPKIRYQTNKERSSQLDTLQAFLGNWRTYWENKQLDKYISLYSSRFKNRNKGIAAWKAYKEGVFSRAGKIQLRVNLESVVQNNKYAVLTFRQDYHSNRLTSREMKRLFAVQEKDGWKVMAEELMQH